MVPIVRRWAQLVFGSVAIAALLGVGYASVYAKSTALLNVRHPKPASTVHAAADPADIRRGGHLVVVTACVACHGEQLAGSAPASGRFAPNLTIIAARRSDADLDAAIRHGLRPDGVSEIGMPSAAYSNLTDDEVAAVIGYLRTLPARGDVIARPPPGLLLRINLLEGRFKTETRRLAEAKPPLEVEPGFAAGRHLASLACGQCHATDLFGGGGVPAPDITVNGYYSRAQFHTLMRTGVTVEEGDTELMSRTALRSFSHFTDSEIDAIFDYLQARDQAMKADRRKGRS